MLTFQQFNLHCFYDVNTNVNTVKNTNNILVLLWNIIVEIVLILLWNIIVKIILNLQTLLKGLRDP